MKNSMVSTGHNGDGQRADFSGFPARGNELRDVGLDPFPRMQITPHPPEGLSRSPSDGRSDARRCERSAEPTGAALLSPAAASDRPFSSDHPILKHARAC
jgi:hypothetical protein